MKKVIILSVFLLYGCILSAQDIITKKDGTDIKAKVTEVSQSQISYKKYSNLNGPLYTISTSDILMITYENGEREMFTFTEGVTQNYTFPQGMMTYNSWSGNVSIGGVTVERGVLNQYFSRNDYRTFQVGKAIAVVGGIVAIIGAVPFGYSVGSLIGGGIANKGILIGGGVAFASGFITSLIGEGMIRRAINNYNSSLAFQPEIQFGATPNGVGIALVF